MSVHVLLPSQSGVFFHRLQSNVPGEGVEINALRATLGVRPIPIPISGAIRGVLHVTGPLERPTFSGARLPTCFSGHQEHVLQSPPKHAHMQLNRLKSPSCQVARGIWVRYTGK